MADIQLPSFQGAVSAVTDKLSVVKKSILDTINGATDAKPKTNRLTDFIAKLNTYGVAYSHAFYVTIAPNSTISTTSSGEFDLVSFYCASTELPASNILTSTYREYSAHYDIPYGISYEPVTMSFLSDKDMIIKSFFDDWNTSIYNRKTNKIKFMDDFRSRINIFVLDRENLKANTANTIYMITLFNAWPKTVGNISLNHSPSNPIIFPVSFQYEKMVISDINASNAIDAMNSTSNVAKSANVVQWPMSVIQKVKNASAEVMQGINTGIEKVYNPISGSSNASTASSSVSSIRSTFQNDASSLPIA